MIPKLFEKLTFPKEESRAKENSSFMSTPRSNIQITEFFQIKGRTSFTENYNL